MKARVTETGEIIAVEQRVEYPLSYWRGSDGKDYKYGEIKLLAEWHGFLQENNKEKQQRIHPTEKPIELYEWLLQNYAKPGFKILDTHGGSMSHAIAAHKLGFDLTIIEKDPVYYEQAKQRLLEFQRQLTLF